jgi:chemotaxis protein methyltransferase CheR
MTETERVQISDFIVKDFGIKMPPAKKPLLEGRLAKRLNACGMSTYEQYFRFVTEDPAGRDEFLTFADLVSTHETSFFREAQHFDLLKNRVLPGMAKRPGFRSLHFLSAACSTGEEAYTLAMVAAAFLESIRRDDIDLMVEGFDLSERAANMATRGVYSAERTKTISSDLRHRYLMTSKDPNKNLCRIVPELRHQTRFHTGNLLSDTGLGTRNFDIIFCRNVLIYFDHPTQFRVVSTLLRHLKPGGVLFLGHSESLSSQGLPVRALAHAVWEKQERGIS